MNYKIIMIVVNVKKKRKYFTFLFKVLKKFSLVFAPQQIRKALKIDVFERKKFKPHLLKLYGNKKNIDLIILE